MGRSPNDWLNTPPVRAPRYAMRFNSPLGTSGTPAKAVIVMIMIVIIMIIIMIMMEIVIVMIMNILMIILLLRY